MAEEATNFDARADGIGPEAGMEAGAAENDTVAAALRAESQPA